MSTENKLSDFYPDRIRQPTQRRTVRKQVPTFMGSPVAESSPAPQMTPNDTDPSTGMATLGYRIRASLAAGLGVQTILSVHCCSMRDVELVATAMHQESDSKAN